MKYIRIAVLSLLAAFVLFFAFVKPDSHGIAGNWNVKEIAIDGKSVAISKDETLTRGIEPHAAIGNFRKTIAIAFADSVFEAKYEIQKLAGNNRKLLISAPNSPLDGVFDVEIDSAMANPRTLLIRMNFVRQELFCIWNARFSWRNSRQACRKRERSRAFLSDISR